MTTKLKNRISLGLALVMGVTSFAYIRRLDKPTELHAYEVISNNGKTAEEIFNNIPKNFSSMGLDQRVRALPIIEMTKEEWRNYPGNEDYYKSLLGFYPEDESSNSVYQGYANISRKVLESKGQGKYLVSIGQVNGPLVMTMNFYHNRDGDLCSDNIIYLIKIKGEEINWNYISNSISDNNATFFLQIQSTQSGRWAHFRAGHGSTVNLEQELRDQVLNKYPFAKSKNQVYFMPMRDTNRKVTITFSGMSNLPQGVNPSTNTKPELLLDAPTGDQTLNNTGTLTINGRVRERDTYQHPDLYLEIEGTNIREKIEMNTPDSNLYPFSFKIPASKIPEGDYTGKVKIIADDRIDQTVMRYPGKVIVDKTPPKISLKYSTTSPTNQNVVVTATTDKGTLNKTSHTFTDNGTYTFTATSPTGLKSTATASVTNIKKTPPTLTLSKQGEPFKNQSIKVTATDPTGIKSIKYKTSLYGTWKTVNINTPIISNLPSSKSNIKIDVEVEDMAGNKITKSELINVPILDVNVSISPEFINRLPNTSEASIRIENKGTPIKAKLKVDDTQGIPLTSETNIDWKNLTISQTKSKAQMLIPTENKILTKGETDISISPTGNVTTIPIQLNTGSALKDTTTFNYDLSVIVSSMY